MRPAHTYESNIDGLRAVAVLGVLTFHALPRLLPGGFLGVDVFFVISGYLITGILHREMTEGTFSLARFYERRARRILPALILVCLATTVAGWFVLLPDAFEKYGQSLVAVGVFGANYFFLKSSGYFDGASHEKPLLHTWSLGVEEQFYVAWPLLMLAMLALFGTARARLLAIGLVLLASLAYSEFLVRVNENAAFFSTFSRAWQLAAGALLALSPARTLLSRTAHGREIASIAGLALIAAAFVLLSEDSSLPGIAALVPTVGAALVIMAGASSLGGRILSASALVRIGLVSYPLYLWHWPILALHRYQTGAPPEPGTAVLVLGASYLLAEFTYRFIERPIRSPAQRLPGTTRRVLVSSAAALSACIVVGAALKATKGWPARLDGETRAVYETLNQSNPRRQHCDGHDNAFRNDAACNFGVAKPQNASFDLVVFGDSNADHWVPMLEDYARRNNLSGRQVTQSACGPVLGSDHPQFSRSRNQDCATYHQTVVDFLERNPGTKIVVVAGHWSAYDTKLGRNRVDLGKVAEAAANKAAEPGTLKWFVAATVAHIRSKGPEVLVIGSIPHLPHFAARCVAEGLKTGAGTGHCGIKRAEADSQIKASTEIFEELAAASDGVFLLKPAELICSKAECDPVLDGTLLYRDLGHLNASGARLLGRRMAMPVLDTDSAD
jgi:peptidoglycan/LPS O-acetylase OafA/YrhL